MFSGSIARSIWPFQRVSSGSGSEQQKGRKISGLLLSSIIVIHCFVFITASVYLQ